MLLQEGGAQIVGVASLPLPHAQQVATVALDTQGFLHLFFTPLSTGVVVWDPNTDVPVTAQQGVPGAALNATRAAATSQHPERAVNSIGSGKHCGWAALLLSLCSTINVSPAFPDPQYSLTVSQRHQAVSSSVPAGRYCLPPMCKVVSCDTAEC